MDKEALKEKFGIEVESQLALTDCVSLLRLENQEQVILKARRTLDKNFMDDHRFDNEVRMYHFFNQKKLQHLHAPRILSKAGPNTSEFILEFIPKIDDKEIDVNEFVEAYIELQTLDVPRNFKLDFINQYAIGFFYKIVIVSLATLRKKLGLATCLRIIWFYFKLSLSSKKLDRNYWLHGDLNRKNFFYSQKNNLLHFIDFEIMFFTNKWLLTEVIAKCFLFDVEQGKLKFDLAFLKVYLDKAQYTIKGIDKINLKQQFKFSILQRSVQVIAHTKIKTKKQEYVRLLNTIMDDALFDAWYGAHVGPVLTARNTELLPS
jgi:hypothetical protein